jgi:O-antigen/teichoic acid export membrane protein
MSEEQGRAASTSFSGFVFNVNMVFATTVVTYGLGFLVSVLIARGLGPEGRGITALYQSAVGLAFAFLSLGIASSAVYFVARRDITARDATRAGLSITLAATAVTAIGVAIAGLLYGDQLADRDVPYWLALVAVPAVIQYRVVEAVLRAQGRYGAMNVIELLLPVTLCLGLVGVDLATGLTVSNTVAVWSFAFLPAALLGYALLGSSAWPVAPAGRTLLAPVVRFGLQGQLSNLIQLLNYRLDSYLVLLLLDTAAVGIYAIGVSLSEGMWFIANSVAVVLLTEITSGDAEQAGRMTPVVCRNTLLVTALASLGAAVVSPFVIPAVFGAAFDAAVGVFLWLLPGTVALAGTKILAAYVFSRGRPMLNAAIATVTLVVTLALDLALIPPFGVNGAAAAASGAYILSLVLTAIAYRRLSGGSIAAALLPRFEDVALYQAALRSALQRLRPARGVGRGLPGEQ